MVQNAIGVEERTESTVRDFLEVVFRRKWSIIWIVLITTAIVVFVNLRQPVMFESSGRMMVRRGEATGVFSAQIRTLTWEEEISSQIEMVKSQPVLRRARELVRELLPEGHETEEVIHAARVGSGVISRSNVLWVSYSTNDPIFCEAAVNAIINSYREYYQSVRTPPEMEDFFLEEKIRLKEETDYWRERKERLGMELGTFDMALEERRRLDLMSRQVAVLEEIDISLLREERILSRLKKYGELGADELAALISSITGPVGQRSIAENYLTRLVDLKLRESEMVVNYTDAHRDLQQVREQIEYLSGKLEKELESMLAVKLDDVEILRLRQRELQSQLQRLETQSNLFPVRAIEFERVNMELLGVEKRYIDLLEQHMQAKISMASNREWTVTVLSPASPAQRKKVRDYVRMSLGPLFSLIVAVGFAFFVDNLDHSIKNVSEAENKLGLQVLASFPEIEQ